MLSSEPPGTLGLRSTACPWQGCVDLGATSGVNSCIRRKSPCSPIEGRAVDSWLDRDPADAQTSVGLGEALQESKEFLAHAHSCVEQEKLTPEFWSQIESP
ncbi:hypothetical protein NDU88_002613 [Pleurodeles waltl]|uniref:Uncharacterized protein n=1 Tax=Pleurodeles waltl TaxID=8319 RepID=A0AAV7RF15_PLEWA|nr:hypothetical protein NDU88_002613 [Pleurodeles waltl]